MTDRALGFIAVALIWIYQRFVSRWTGRVCHFRPTCSTYSSQQFRKLGYRAGLIAARARLADCCGTYALRMGAERQVEMLARSGRVYPQLELAPHVVEKLGGGIGQPQEDVGWLG